ncbi:response regulator [uncultured Methylobacterium sp.]|jgi:CheY-like chemotaxis protein|uniref:response regulator n=1 Tax=uncultured Methylobacterium sp. TaxID=157278 RepID=UPI00261AF3D0|nr:response regulator [uncultured Methylobacterium sp.]
MRPADRFYQAAYDGTSKPILHGVGRGLAEAYGAADHEPLPDRLRELAQMLIDREAARAGAGTQAAAPMKLVLVVEDDPSVRDLAVSLLQDTVLDAVACETGEDAVELLRQRGGDVAMLFTDVRLPGGMDGLRLAETVSKLWPCVRLVVTSGFPDVRTDALPDNVVYLPKPWQAVDVLAQVDHAVRNPPPPVD